MQVYRWQVQMVTSLLHRATGIVLTLGTVLFVWALLALADGPERWSQFTGFARSPIGFLILFGWSWSLVYHLLNGVRHIRQDAGWGFHIPAVLFMSWFAVVGSLVLTAVIWLIAMTQWGNA